MPQSDRSAVKRRFEFMATRITTGLELQRQRIQDCYDRAPRLLPGSTIEVVDLTADRDRGNDLDYYIYELGRLQDAGREILKAFDRPQAVVDALEAFDRAIPNLRRIRNPLTHTDGTDRLDNVTWFSSVVALEGVGQVRDLVDPRYGHHDAALALAKAIESYLDSVQQVP
jgi:hypothetical protein